MNMFDKPLLHSRKPSKREVMTDSLTVWFHELMEKSFDNDDMREKIVDDFVRILEVLDYNELEMLYLDNVGELD
jgi:hypothetical protein